MCYYVENIFIFGVFKKQRQLPGTLGVSTQGRELRDMYLETAEGVHVGSLDCRQYSVSELEVESLVQ